MDEDKNLPQYKFMEYNLLSSLKNDLWTQFLEAISREFFIQREKIKETKYLYDYKNQLEDGIIRISKMFGYIPNLIVDNSLEMLYKEFESIPFRIRNKTNYNGYNIIFNQISQKGEVYNFFWNDKKFIRAILTEEIFKDLNNLNEFNKPFCKMYADKNFSSISNLDKIKLDQGIHLDERLGKSVWQLDENSGTMPTKHLGIEYYADELFLKDNEKYLMTSEYFQYLLQGVIYTKRCPIIPHIGIDVTSIIAESEGFDYFNREGQFSIPEIELKSCCGYEYVRGFNHDEPFVLDEGKILDNIVPNWKLDANVKIEGRPVKSDYKYISCGAGSLPLVNFKNENIYDFNSLILFYTFSDNDDTDIIKDYSVNSNNSKVYGNTKKTEGIVGKSVDWDGSTYVKSENTLIFPSIFTLGLWVKAKSKSCDETLCVLDVGFIKMYFDYNSNEFIIHFNNDVIKIDAEQDVNYDVLFEFSSEDVMNIYFNAELKSSVSTVGVSYGGNHTLYLGTDSSILDSKFIGIIDDLFIVGKKFTIEEIKYLYESKFGIITHLANKLATYELDLSKEYEENQLWTMISSQVHCNDVRNEFALKVKNDEHYIGFTNFSPLINSSFSFKYTKNLGFMTEEIKVNSDKNGNFYTIDSQGRYVFLGGHIDYENGMYQIDKFTMRSVVNKHVNYNVMKIQYNTEKTNLIKKTVNIQVNFVDGGQSITDNGEGKFKSGYVLDSDINYEEGKIMVVFGSEPLNDVVLSFDYLESLDMLDDSNIYFDYKVESSDESSIREIALENANHEILAYMTFPPIQAYDEYNYVSANFMIKKTNT